MAAANANERMIRENSKVEQKGKKDYRQNTKFKPRGSAYSAKDDDEDNASFGQKNNEGKKRTTAKEINEQSEKIEIFKRLEREKKALQRKLREEETERQKRPQSKMKRNNNKNYWTINYMNSIDDYEE